MSEGVELQVTNLDPGIDQRDARQLVIALFNEFVNLSSVNVYKQEGGGLGAIVRVGNINEAKIAISQLHKRKVGTKRISVSLLPVDSIILPKKEVVSILQSVPGEKIHLFKFRQMYEERFRSIISVADLYKMKDVVTLLEDVSGSGRMIHLKPNADVSIDDVENLHCELHCPNVKVGWAEKNVWEGLPDVKVKLDTLSANIQLMLRTHNGSIPLASFVYCYNAEFENLDLDEAGVGRNGVPLEHLLQAVKGIVINSGATGIKNIVEYKPENITPRPVDFLGPPPALAGQLIIFTREVVDLLKTFPGSKLAFYKFIPKYHHHFGKQCRVADYGFTKLKDLLESIPHVVQIVGEGSKMVITLAHKAQVRRFTNDLLKMLKNQPEKQFLLSSFSCIYEKNFQKQFNVYDYGVCFLQDILGEVPENTILSENVVLTEEQRDVMISIFKRDQTKEEIMRTRGFAKEVVELLRHMPELCISFHKFIPAYHQHFGRQCRVGSYGMSKLIELFEAIPDTVEIIEDGEEKTLQLTKDKMIWVVGEQLECVVKASRARFVALADLEEEYQKMYGHAVPFKSLQVSNIDELIFVLNSWVRITDMNDSQVVVAVDRSFIRTMANNIRRLLLEQDGCQMPISEFVSLMSSRFGCNVEMEMLKRDLSYLVEVKDGIVGLSALQMCARDIEKVLGDIGKLPVAELDSQFEAKFGRELPLEPLGFDSVHELLVAMNDTLIVKGRGIRKVVSVNKNCTSVISPSRPSSIIMPPVNSQKVTDVASFSGRGFDMIRMVTPQTVPRSYSGVVQSTEIYRNVQNLAHVPSYQYNVPPPSHRYAHPPCYDSGSNSSCGGSRNYNIPLAAPNSPETPTTPMSFNGFQFPSTFTYSNSTYSVPLSPSPSPTVTFHQHMMRHSPSPLIASTQSPYIVQPIAKVPPNVGFYGEMKY